MCVASLATPLEHDRASQAHARSFSPPFEHSISPDTTT